MGIGSGRGGIGLDIGTSAVRAAEIRGGRPPVVSRFGQVLLPRGAVKDGEVEDPGAVAQAISTLWKRAGFASRVVRVGVSNQRVVVRQIELPAMPREELEGAIQFQGQELIPIPLHEAVMDFEVMEEFTGSEGQPMQRVMVVAAQRWMVDRLLAAVTGAKLQPESLELNAYPLVRALGEEAPVATQAEAIVDIGAGVTNVVVHLGGRIRFVRILRIGGDDFTEDLAAQLNLEWDDAESLKHKTTRALAARVEGEEVEAEEDVQHATDILFPRLQRFVDEVRGSLDYYNVQPDALPLGRVLATGGGSLLGGLIERLGSPLRIDAEPAHAFQGVRVGKVKLEPAQVDAAEPFLGVAIGLALGSLET